MDFALVPITSRAAWEGKPIYEILIDRLCRLQQWLVAQGFDDPVLRIQFHLDILKRLQRSPKIDSDQTLSSLVEATELADIYGTLPRVSSQLFRQKFSAVLSGPFSPQQETTESSLARNTLFELYLAGWLSCKGIPTEICHNPDISCTVADRQLFIQCKRPFSRKSVVLNIKRACKQLSFDLDKSIDAKNRGVVAVSLTHAMNPGNIHTKIRTESDLTSALTSQIRSLADHLLHLVSGRRIVGLVFSLTTAVLVEDVNEYRTGQVMALYPSKEASDADRATLRRVFMRQARY